MDCLIGFVFVNNFLVIEVDNIMDMGWFKVWLGFLVMKLKVSIWNKVLFV